MKHSLSPTPIPTATVISVKHTSTQSHSHHLTRDCATAYSDLHVGGQSVAIDCHPKKLEVVWMWSASDSLSAMTVIVSIGHGWMTTIRDE